MQRIFQLSLMLLLAAMLVACAPAAEPPAATEEESAETTESEATTEEESTADTESMGEGVMVMDPFARASIPNGAVYMTLMNEGSTDDALVSASTDAAEVVELHETTMDENDVMQMRPVTTIPIPAGESTTLEPGGLHVMLIDIDENLAEGDTIEVTLEFEQAEAQTISVEVRAGPSMGHGMEHGDMAHDNDDGDSPRDDNDDGDGPRDDNDDGDSPRDDNDDGDGPRDDNDDGDGPRDDDDDGDGPRDDDDDDGDPTMN